MSPADDIDTLQLGPDPDKLELYHRQQLSAMLDGELPQDQARFLRRRLQHDAELSGCFERWQVCGDVLRGRQVSLLPPDFAARIAAGIAADGVVVAPVAVARRPRLARWGGGAALAASVALVALFVGRPGVFQDEDNELRTAPVADVAAPVAPPAVNDAVADAAALAAPATDAGIALVGTAALAGAAATRGTGERATRSRSQRAAVSDVRAPAEDAARVAVAGPSHSAASADAVGRAGSDAGAGLFAGVPEVVGLPEADLSARPWPRASTLSANSSFSVRYGDGFAAPSWREAEAPDSAVLPRFPVDPADAGIRPRALR